MFNLIPVLVVLGVVIWLIWRFGTRVVVQETRSGEIVKIPRVSPARAAPIAIVGLLVLILLPASIKVVPVGHGLVVFNVLTRSLKMAPQGVHLILPWVNQVTLYDLRRIEYTMAGVRGEGRKRDVDDSLWSPTKEGLQVGIDLTAWHRIDPRRVADIHQRIGPQYEEKVVRPAIRSVVRHVISEYPIMDVYSAKRKLIQEEINRRLIELLEKDGFIIDSIILRDVRFPTEFAKAIEQKQIAQQEAERMKYILEKETREAERKEIEAGGTAKKIDIVNAALKRSPDYINYLYVDKLSDKIKVIVSDQSTIMDLKGMTGD